MARKKSQEITRRVLSAARQSEAPSLAVQADQSAGNGYSALGAAAADTLSRLGNVANAAVTNRLRKQVDADEAKGARDRTTESLNGTPAQTADALVAQSAPYRRGYFLTEGVNRIQQAKLELTREVAKLRPGEDINPLVQQRMAQLLEAPEFQDPAVLKQLTPALQQMQLGIAEVRQKTELAEIFDSQTENLRELARAGIQDGSLGTPEGIARFRAALDTEPFAFLDKDDADDILASAYADLVETGAVDPETAKASLQRKLPGDTVSLWDRNDKNGQPWNAKFDTALRAGASIRAKAIEEQQANQQAGIEPQLQERAGNGRLSTPEIYTWADKIGLDGKDKLTFVRHWIDRNQAGQRRLESEAKAAARHKEVIQAINAGNALSLTDSELSKSAKAEWAQAVQAGDRAKQSAVIAKYTRAGVVIPQLKDLLSRTTERNLTSNYALYEALSKIDRVAADRYLSEDNATLFAQHHDNLTLFGMTPQESLQALPTGATKGRREDVAAEIGRASTRYFKDNTEMVDGSPRPPWFNQRVQQTATQLALANPNASPEVNLQVAERRLMGGLLKVNGRWVARGGARPEAVPGIEAFTKRAGTDLVKAKVIDESLEDQLYAAPHPADPNLFVVMLPNGYPAYNPKTGRPVAFDALQVGQGYAQYTRDRTEAEVRFESNRRKTTTDVFGIDATQAAKRRTAKGTDPATWGKAKPAPAVDFTPEPDNDSGFQFPDFIDYLHSQKRPTGP